MGAVAVGAIARRSRMLHFGFLDQLSFVRVTGHTKRLDVLLCQHYLPVFCWCVAGVTLFVGKGRVREFGHQLRSG